MNNYSMKFMRLFKVFFKISSFFIFFILFNYFILNDSQILILLPIYFLLCCLFGMLFLIFKELFYEN